MSKDDGDFFDDAAAFWRWINERHDNGGDEQPFLSGEEGQDNPLADFDFDPDDFGDLSDVLLMSRDEAYLTDHEIASTAYTIAEIGDAIAYCRDAPPGILRMLVLENGEVEIYRFPS